MQKNFASVVRNLSSNWYVIILICLYLRQESSQLQISCNKWRKLVLFPVWSSPEANFRYNVFKPLIVDKIGHLCDDMSCCFDSKIHLDTVYETV